MKKIVVDFTGCKYIMKMHKILKEAFNLPDYYGNNWDALWDCLDYYTISPLIVEIKGISTMPSEFKEEVQIMLKVFEDVHKNSPNIEFIVIS